MCLRPITTCATCWINAMFIHDFPRTVAFDLTSKLSSRVAHRYGLIIIDLSLNTRGHSHTPLLCRYAFSRARLSNRFCNRKKCFPTSWVVASSIHVCLYSYNSHKSQSTVAQKNANTRSHLRTDLERD